MPLWDWLLANGAAAVVLVLRIIVADARAAGLD
jgi:hypothetical protein